MESTSGRSLLERRPTTPLSHYTSHPALVSILESGEIWASNIRYLNDREEFFHAIAVCKRTVTQQSGCSARSPTRARYLEKISTVLDKDLRDGELATMVYVASFCEEKDSLTLWRGYSPARSGYSFGFNWSADSNPELAFTPCIYDEAEKRSVLLDFVDEFEGLTDPEVRRQLGHLSRDAQESLLRQPTTVRAILFTQRLAIIAPAMKHPSFRDEREWRVVYFKPTDSFEPEYRCGATMLIPYARIPLRQDGTLQVEEIVVGPTDHPDEAKESLVGFMRKTPNVRCRSIISSQVPFRHL